MVVPDQHILLLSLLLLNTKYIKLYKYRCRSFIILIFRRLREKYEKEIKDLETAEKESKVKFIDSKTKLLESEEVIIGLKATVKQLETQVSEYKEV